jgi:hypothetical protein
MPNALLPPRIGPISRVAGGVLSALDPAILGRQLRAGLVERNVEEITGRILSGCDD